MLIIALSLTLREAEPNAFGSAMRVTLVGAGGTPGTGAADIGNTSDQRNSQTPSEPAEPPDEPFAGREAPEEPLLEPEKTVTALPQEHLPEPQTLPELRTTPQIAPRPEPKPKPASDPKPVPKQPKSKTTPVKRETKPEPVKPSAKPAKSKPKSDPKPAQPSQAATKPAGGTAGRGEPNASPQPGAEGRGQPTDSGGGGAPGRPEPAAHGAGVPVNIEDGFLKVTKKVPPEYPALSRKRREQGVVVLLADITSGRTESVRVEQTSGHPRLDEAAMRAVKEWRFDTSSYGPRVTARIPFKFELKYVDR
jgi:protein TonB